MRNLEHEIPGFLGLAGDLQARIAALGEDDVPTEWTPEHVGARLVEAFAILRKAGAHVGPMQFGNAWPDYLRTKAEVNDLDALANHTAEAHMDRSRPTSDEVSRMNEALRWPMDYLDGMVLASDALMFWAYAKATGRDMADMIHQRKKRATALAEEATRRANAPAHHHPETGEMMDTRSAEVLERNARRMQIAREVCRDCNDAMSRAPKAKHGEIRLQAQNAFRARCRDLDCEPVKVKPIEAMPGRVMSRTTLDRYRKTAAAAVASGLRRAGVPVR